MTLRITLYAMTMITDYGDPTTPSADEELTALPVDTTDYVEHDLELQNDLDLELAAAVHDDDDDDEQRRSDDLALSDIDQL